ncbi:FtsX-like permease family protein [Eggerthellaceae bacterium 3-80]|nr:FtsX-like permease family protein [bacterium D16-34]
MRNIFTKDTLRSITHSWGRFLAIAAIVALGTGFYAGLRMTAPDMNEAADEYFDGTHLMDIRVVSTLGLTDADIKALREVEGVAAVMPAYETDVIATIGSDEYATRVHSLPDAARTSQQFSNAAVSSDDPDYLNRLVLLEGSWPTNPGECVIQKELPVNANIALGDVIELTFDASSDNNSDSEDELEQDLGDPLLQSSYKVVGFVSAPYYATTTPLGKTDLGTGTIQEFMYVPESDFSSDYPYTEAFIEVKGASDEFATSEGYTACVQAVLDKIEALAPEREQARVDELKEDAQKTLDERKRDFEEKKADATEKLDNAKDQLDEASETLESSKRELESARREYDRGVAELKTKRSDVQAQLDDAQEEIDTSRKNLEAAKPKLTEGKENLDAAWATWQEGFDDLNAGKAQWQEKSRQLEDGIAQVQAGISQAQAGIDQANEGIAQLEEAIAQAQTQRDQLNATLQSLLANPSANAAKIAELRQQIAGLDATLSHLRSQRDESTGKRDAAQQTLSDLQTQQQTLSGQREALAQAKSELDTHEQELAEGKARLDREQAAYDEQAQAYQDGLAKLDSAQAELDAQRTTATEQLDDAQAQLDDAKAQIDDGQKQLDQGQTDYDKGLEEYSTQKAEADEQLNDAERKLADAQRTIDDLETPEWLVMDRDANYGAASFESDATRVDNIASVFPFIFFLVAALVALTSMTRMVDEERMLIGTYKALGYTRLRISFKYLTYAALASVSGSVIGVITLSQLLPYIIMKAYAIIYSVPIPPFPLPMHMPLALLAAGLGVGVTLFATAAAAWATLREKPAALMLPRAPKAGKAILLERVTFLWRRLSFSWKVTLRNIFRYKKRLVMTVIGIAGCTALLLTGLGLSNAINDIIDKQYFEIMRYDTTVTLDDHIIDADRARVDEVLSDPANATNYIEAQQKGMLISGPDASDKAIDVLVPKEPERFSDFYVMRTRAQHMPVELSQDGFVLTEKVAAELGVEVGDVVTLTEQDTLGNPVGESSQAQVTGIVENYVYHYAFIGPALYEALFGEPVVYDCDLAISANPQDRSKLVQELDAIPGVKTVAFNDESIETYRTMLGSVDMIVVVLVVAAAALAFIVLYNLTNINITERIREIATLKVLGFTPKETTAYIFREIFVLSVLGALFGLVLGVGMEGFVVTTAEVDQVMFGRDIHLSSFVIAFLLTLVFTLIVRLAMRPKLKHINMVESLKSNE